MSCTGFLRRMHSPMQVVRGCSRHTGGQDARVYPQQGRASWALLPDDVPTFNQGLQMDLRRAVLKAGVVTNGVDRRPALAFVVDSRCQRKHNQFCNVLKRHLSNESDVFPGHMESEVCNECESARNAATSQPTGEYNSALGRARERTMKEARRRTCGVEGLQRCTVTPTSRAPARHSYGTKLCRQSVSNIARGFVFGGWKLPMKELYIERWASISMQSRSQADDALERRPAAARRAWAQQVSCGGRAVVRATKSNGKRIRSERFVRAR